MSTKIRSVAGCAVHYCRFKRCIKTLANGAAIECARIRYWSTVITVKKKETLDPFEGTTRETFNYARKIYNGRVVREKN